MIAHAARALLLVAQFRHRQSCNIRQGGSTSKRASIALGVAFLARGTRLPRRRSRARRRARARRPSRRSAASNALKIGFAGAAHRPGCIPRTGAAELDAVRNTELQPSSSGRSFKVVLGDFAAVRGARGRTGRPRSSSPNRNIMAVIGGSTSQSVISSAGLFRNVRLATRSPPSATRVDLTNGRLPDVLRVVPHDGVQAPEHRPLHRATQLRADRVVVLDSQDDYSVRRSPMRCSGGLLRGRGVAVDRESTAASDDRLLDDRDGRVAADADVVVFATQTASAAPAPVRSAARAGQECGGVRDRRRVLAEPVQAAQRLRVRRSPTTSTSCRPRGGRPGGTPVEHLLEEQGVRHLRAAGRTWPRGPLFSRR